MMQYELREHPMLPGSWEITAKYSNGEVAYFVLFGGHDAQDRAQEYMDWKQTGRSQ